MTPNEIREPAARLELRSSPVLKDCALAAGRVALAWIFIYHGAGTLFGAFHECRAPRDRQRFLRPTGFAPGCSSPC